MVKTTNKTIPLAKAAFRKQFTDAMIDLGIKPGKYYRKVGLPAQEPEDLETLVPLRPIYRLAARVAIEEGIPDFGSRVARFKPWHKVESLRPLISKSKTLGKLLQTLCEVASGQRADADFRLGVGEFNHWFEYHGRNIIKNDVQMELYRLTGMIQLVQLAAGSGWRPKRIELQMSKNTCTDYCEMFGQSELTFSRDVSRISVPHVLFNLPVNLDIPETTKSYGDDYDINANLIDTIKQIIPLYIGGKLCKIETFATVSEVSARSLQRRLRANGTSFNEIVGEVRYKLAKIGLKDRSLTVSGIAHQLGYSDIAHFTRAFKRWSGVTPTEYRKPML